MEHVLPLDEVVALDLYAASGVCMERRGAGMVVAEAAGLAEEEAMRRLAEAGFNELTPQPRKPQWLLFLQQLLNMFMVMLWVSGILSIIAYLLDRSVELNLWLGIVLFFIVLATSLMSFWQERKTSKLMDIFSLMAPPLATVRRGGQLREIESRYLVPGDIISFKEGDIVPADCRLLKTNNVRLEISSLTGESAPLSGTAEPSRPETPVHESRCMAFSGSVCLQGLALALVVRTGDRTMIGQIAALAASNAQRPAASSLEREMTYFVRFVAILAFVTAAVFFLIGLGRQGGDNALNLFINGFLIVIVANVPQGLPATVTSLLAITAKRMAAQNVFVKRLDVIEALGAASVICSDKTGTLTQNVMTVRELFCNGMTLTAGFETHFSPPAANLKSSMRKKNDLAVNWLGIVAAVCNGASRTPPAHNAATLVAVPADPAASKSAVAPAPAAAAAADAAAASSTSSSSDDHDQFLGSPSEVALLRFVGQYVSVETLRSQYEILAEIPFNSANKWHMMVCAPRNTDPLHVDALHKPLELAAKTVSAGGLLTGHAAVALMKGAPEVVLSMCSCVLENGALLPVTPEMTARVTAAIEHFGGQLGRRMMGFAGRLMALTDKMRAVTAAGQEWSESDLPRSEFVFFGLAALADPPRENVNTAVEQCRQAGIRVFMVTGDHPQTAQAIAREVGIIAADDQARAAHRTLPGQAAPGVYMSSHVSRFSPEDWLHVLSLDGAVFARATPEDKLVIVTNCQTHGHVVAVTGDGVNDAPALRKADIGIGMGKSGNAVAREAAQVLLMDDNFASIVNAVLEGRLIIDNLRKTIRYVLTHLMPEIIPTLLNLSIGLPLAMPALHVLSIDLGTELGASISLAYEPPEPGIMQRPPRPKTERLVTRSMLVYAYVIAGGLETLVCFVAYAYVFRSYGISLSDIVIRGDEYFKPDAEDLTLHGRNFSSAFQAQVAGEAASAWYITLVMAQVAHVWLIKAGSRSVFATSPFANVITFYGIALEILVLLLLTYLPGVQVFMGADVPQSFSWVFWLISALLLLIYHEIRVVLCKSHHENVNSTSEPSSPVAPPAAINAQQPADPQNLVAVISAV